MNTATTVPTVSAPNAQRPDQRLGRKYCFDDADMDLFFMSALSFGPTGGLDIGQAFHIASTIVDGDADSWVRSDHRGDRLLGFRFPVQPLGLQQPLARQIGHRDGIAAGQQVAACAEEQVFEAMNSSAASALGPAASRCSASASVATSSPARPATRPGWPR